MKLLELRSDNKNFRTITFKDGLNIIAGLQRTDSNKKTYNGVGKSFTLNLVHLMLGSRLDKKKQKKVYDFLSKYGNFYLQFTQDGEPYTIQKDFSKTDYYINGKKVNQSSFPKEIRDIIIGDKLNSNVTFKHILNTFARRYGGSYYSNILTQQDMPESDYYQRYTNLSLLNVETDLVEEKFLIKNKLNQLTHAEKAVKEYEPLLEKSNIKDLEDQLSTLITEKNEFIIAENYDKFLQEADLLTADINKMRNDSHELNNSILRKSQSLEYSKSIGVDLPEIYRLYDEAKFFFGDGVKVRLEDANNFHKKLMVSRINRLNTETVSLRKELEALESKLHQSELCRDNILKDLNSKGALEEYTSIHERIKNINSEVQELNKYKTVIEGFKKERSHLDLENARVKNDSLAYLKSTKNEFDTIEDKFRSLVKRFYENSGGSFEIKETVDAKYLYDIQAEIPNDGSQGINEVKIFCYDFLLYSLNPNLLNFIAHDGCIFSEMDPRQKAMIFKVALDHIHEQGLQYFINIGEASLNEVLDKDNKQPSILSKEERQEIEDSIILELYDSDPSNKLFGEQFD
ncbi:MAG: hypothetical protein ACI9TY_000167 [Alphaproteobacteria bacterium]|jgi:uncharacterized protein YydD (DUF2326 family)